MANHCSRCLSIWAKLQSKTCVVTGFQTHHDLASSESKTHRPTQCTSSQGSNKHVAKQTDLHCLLVFYSCLQGLLHIHPTSVPTPVCIGELVAVVLSSACAFCRQMRGPLHTSPSKQSGSAFPWQQCKSACFQMPAGWTWHVLVQIIGKSMIMQQFLQSLIPITHLTLISRAQTGRSYTRMAWCLLTCFAASKTQSASTLLALSNAEACEGAGLQSQDCCCWSWWYSTSLMTLGFACRCVHCAIIKDKPVQDTVLIAFYVKTAQKEEFGCAQCWPTNKASL